MNIYKLSDESGNLDPEYYSSLKKVLKAVQLLAYSEEWDVSPYCLTAYGNEVRNTGNSCFRVGNLTVWIEALKVN